MAFRNAATIVVARLFRLIGINGTVLADFGTKVSTVIGVLSSALRFYHRNPAFTDSAIVWTQAGAAQNETDYIGPGPIGGLPPALILSYNTVGVAPMKAILTGGNGSGLSTDGMEITLTGATLVPGGIILLHAYGSVSGKDAGVQAISGNTDALTGLTLFSPTTPQGKDWNAGTYLGNVFATQFLSNVSLGPNTALTNVAGTVIVATAAMAQPRDLALWEIVVTYDLLNIALGWAQVIGDLMVSGGGYGAGVAFGDVVTWIDGTAGNRAVFSKTWFLNSTETPGTNLTFSFRCWKTAAGGNVQINGGLTTIKVIRRA